MKNKRGDIPVVILVIGVVMICSLAIASFFLSDFKIKKELLGAGLIEEVNSDIEKFYFYKNLGDTKEEAERKIGAEKSEIMKFNSILEVRYKLPNK